MLSPIAPRKVDFTITRDVAAPAAQVWDAIGHFDTMSWHPGLESGEVQGDLRTLVSKGGAPVFQEKLLEQGPNFLRYQMVAGLPVQPEARLEVDPLPGGGSHLSWEGQFDAQGLDAASVTGLEKGIGGFYAAGLDSLQERFGYLAR